MSGSLSELTWTMVVAGGLPAQCAVITEARFPRRAGKRSLKIHRLLLFSNRLYRFNKNLGSDARAQDHHAPINFELQIAIKT